MQFVFSKGSGKHDRMEVVRANDSLERIDCPKQRLIPHDMCAMWSRARWRSAALSRGCYGARAGMRMRGEAESDGVERLVEVIHG